MSPWTVTIALLAVSGSMAAHVWAAPPEAAPPNLLASPEPMISAPRTRFGKDARILNLDLRPDGFAVEVQDSTVPVHGGERIGGSG